MEHVNVSEYCDDNGEWTVEGSNEEVVANCKEAESFITSNNARIEIIEKQRNCAAY